MSRIKHLACFFLSLCLPITASANSSKALQEYYSGHYKQAEPQLTLLAKQKNSKALYALAIMKIYGYGGKKDVAEGLHLMTLSAKHKSLAAQMYLGKYYFDDKHDLKSALIWFRKAADQNNTTAQLYTAIAYLKGYGVKKNTDIARKYIIHTAKKGVPMAQYELAVIFLNNKHRSDKKMGAIWLRKSAEKGYIPAQYKLGVLLYNGNTTIKKDVAKAKTWLEKAAKQGNKAATKQLELIADTSDQPNVIKTANDISETATMKGDATLQLLTEKLKQSGVVIRHPKVITAKGDQQTLTPLLITLTKNKLLQPNYNLTPSKNIPLINIITYASKLSYQRQSQALNILEYPFTLPHGAENKSQALTILQRQARFGHPQAQFKLGQMYELGLDVEQNKEKAFSLYKKSALQHYQKAEYMVGVFYLRGDTVNKNREQAVNYLYRAALKGSTPAQYLLGNIFEHDKHYQLAVGLYNAASQKGLAIAEYRLAQLYASGLLNPDGSYETAIQNVSLAYALYRKAAQKGIKKAKVAAAYFMESNKKTQENIFDNIKDESSNIDAKFLLAIAYDRGIGTSENTSRAMKYYRKLISKNNAFAEYALGTYYYLDDDKEDGIKLLEKSAGQGNPYAQYNLAILLKQGEYQHPQQTFLSLLNTAAKHYNQAKVLLADTYLINNKPALIRKSVQIYKQLAKKQDATAELKLGIMHEDGILFSKNNAKALHWYKQAADHHNKYAQYIAGYMTLIGKGTNRNINSSIKYFTQAAAQNYLPADVALGFIYDMSLYDYTKAEKWYEKAADEDNPQAQYNLALMYKYGKGVDISSWTSGRLYKKSGINNPLWDKQ